MTNINATERLIAIWQNDYARHTKNHKTVNEDGILKKYWKNPITHYYANIGTDVLRQMLEDSEAYDYPGLEFAEPQQNPNKTAMPEYIGSYALSEDQVIQFYHDKDLKNDMQMYYAEEEYDYHRLLFGSRSNPTLGKVFSKVYCNIITDTPISDFLRLHIYRVLNNLDNEGTKFYLLLSAAAAKQLKHESDFTEQISMTTISQIKHNTSKFGTFRPKWKKTSNYGRAFRNILENHACIELYECHDSGASINQEHNYPMAAILTSYKMHERFDNCSIHSPMHPNDHTPTSLKSELIENILDKALKTC
ncbi:hypothetical protein MA9V2_214 [Chryseobacterium phage MA9V-2]|nr:hypothetical protein MA9V2_214 [Chryseobacterium phage MA9V-2]